jgi:hypothetical protein
MIVTGIFHQCNPSSNYGSGVDSVSNRNEYQEYFLGGKNGQSGLTTLPLPCANHHEIWDSQPPGTLRACPGLSRNCFTLIKAPFPQKDNLQDFVLKVAKKKKHYNSKILTSNNKMKAAGNYVRSGICSKSSSDSVQLLKVNGT